MTIKLYLTIDDSPSIHMDKKVAFLKSKNIPAIFYARGEYIKKYPEQIINAIKNGFLIGNHSYTHPYFSKIRIEECFDEILKTEKLINQCYDTAEKIRHYKIVRLPFGDRGVGPKDRVTHNLKAMAIQKFLISNDFKAVNFGAQYNDFVDSYWDWDTEDYKNKYIQNIDMYLENMRSFLKYYKKESAIILLHDFNHNHHLFEESMKFLIKEGIEFLNYNMLHN